MLESLHFVFDGRSSRDFGIINVKLDSGMFEEAFLPSVEFNETFIRGRDEPYDYGAKLSPITFSLNFAFEDEFDSDKLREVARWLWQKDYKPLYFSKYPNRIYYCRVISDSGLIHNGAKQGYISIQFRTQHPWAFSPLYDDMKWYDQSVDPKNVSENLTTGEIVGTGVVVTSNIIGTRRVTWGDLKMKKWGDL